MPPPPLSVVIPTLNEAANLPRTIAHLRGAAGEVAVEVVVSDCDSADATRDVAAGLGARVVTGGRCRGDALNRGAAVAGGRVLLFLHADTLLPDGFARRVLRAVDEGGAVGGAFDFSFGSHPRGRGLRKQGLRVVTAVNRIRFRCGRGFFGDQAIFARRDVFEAVGGFPLVPLLEDVRFCKRMRHLGPTAVLWPPVKTSPRRFVERGVVRTFFADWFLLAADELGHRPRGAWRHYNRLNADGHAERAFK